MASSNPAGGAFLCSQTNPNDVFVPEQFSAEDLLIAQTADSFLRKEVLPHVDRIEAADHDLMRELMHKAGALGLLGADVPVVFGGLGLSHATGCLIAEKLNFQQSFALTHEAHSVIGILPLLYFGSKEQKARCLPKLASGEWIGAFALSESGSGSDALGMQTKAEISSDGSHYILNGEKMWITNTAFADLFTLFARLDGSQITAFLVERGFEGVSFGREEHKLGMHGTSTRRVILQNARVPAANALETGKGHYAALCALNIGRLRLEAGAVGGLKELLSICTAYAKQRKTFGKPIASYGLIQSKLAQMASRTFTLECMVYRIAGLLDRAFAGIDPESEDASPQYHQAAEEYAVECDIVKVIGSETYSAMADEAIQIHGGNGYTEEYPLARAWRDQRLLRIGEGANEIVRLAIVNGLLRREAAGRLALMKACGTAAKSILGAGTAVEESSPIEELSALAETVRLMCLAAMHLQKSGTDLMERQEAAAAIADLICAAFALESIWARCERIHQIAPARLETAILYARAAAIDCANEARAALRFVLETTAASNDADSKLAPKCWEHCAQLGLKNANPMDVRRRLAAKVLETGGYSIVT